MNIREKLSKIQSEFKAKKSRYNSFGKYNFRSAEDILEALKPMNEKYNVSFTVVENIMSPTHITTPIIQSVATIIDNEEGEELAATAIVGIDIDQKGMQMPQRFGAASSYGKKYALGNLLLIDDTADSDATNTHGKKNIVSSKDFKKTEKPVINKDNIEQAKKFLSNGGLMKTLEDKYTITSDARAELING